MAGVVASPFRGHPVITVPMTWPALAHDPNRTPEFYLTIAAKLFNHNPVAAHLVFETGSKIRAIRARGEA